MIKRIPAGKRRRRAIHKCAFISVVVCGERCARYLDPKLVLPIGDVKGSIQFASECVRSKMTDFDVGVKKKIHKSIQRDKQGRYDVSRRGKLLTV